MSKDLVVPAPAGALSELDQAVAAEIAADEHSFVYHPPRYRIAGGGTGMFQNVLDKKEVFPEFRGIILASMITRALWPNRLGEEADDKRPLCWSAGGVQGQWSRDDGSVVQVNCLSCPYNAWGSEVKAGPDGTKRAGRGKACKEMRRFLVLPAERDMPAILTIPPTSCVEFDVYASNLKDLKRVRYYFTVETIIQLADAMSAAGQPYSVAKFQVGPDLAPEQKSAVLALRARFKAAIGDVPEYEEYTDQNGAPKDPLDPDQW